MKAGGGVDAAGFVHRLAAAVQLAAACALLVGANAATAANEPNRPRVLTCKDANGKPIATDPSDPRCYKPPPNETERAAAEEARRRQWDQYNECKAEQRSQQTLLSRYPDKARHDAARAEALAEIENSITASKRRLEKLFADRKRLMDDAEFYPNGNLPAKLKRDIDANSALIAAQTQAIEKAREEAGRKNAFYDNELATLKKLWQPGQAGTKRCVAPAE